MRRWHLLSPTVSSFLCKMELSSHIGNNGIVSPKNRYLVRIFSNPIFPFLSLKRFLAYAVPSVLEVRVYLVR